MGEQPSKGVAGVDDERDQLVGEAHRAALVAALSWPILHPLLDLRSSCQRATRPRSAQHLCSILSEVLAARDASVVRPRGFPLTEPVAAAER